MSVPTPNDAAHRGALLGPEHLFTPLRIGEILLRHRVVAGPWPIGRTVPPGGVPTPAMVSYYAQRATPGGLVVCEPALVAPATSCGGTPGIHASDQVNHWRDVTEEIHARGAYAVAHLCHPGVLSIDRPATLEAVLEDYRTAAENAGDAGFDAVELDVAPTALPASLIAGYSTLPGLDPASDGGRGLRFLTDVLQALTGVWPSHRVGAWLAARMSAVPIAGLLSALDVGYLHAFDAEPGALLPLRQAFPGPWVVAVAGDAMSFDGAPADALSFGEAFASAPDLVDQLRQAHRVSA